jgi:hypothetical protein
MLLEGRAPRHWYNPRVEIRFTCSMADAVEIARRVSMPAKGVFVFLVLLTALFVEGVYLIHLGFSGGYFWLVMAAMLGLTPWLVPRFLAWRAVARKPSEVTFQFLDDGVSVAGPNGKAQLLWRAFSKFEETERMFFLCFRSGRFNSVPKRAMSSEQISELRRILELRIGNESPQ